MTSILQLAQRGEARNLMRDLRVRALYSPYFLAKAVLGYTKMVDHLHLHDSELFVTRWSQGQTLQFIEWPRAFYKTTTFTISVGIWVVLPVTEEDHEYALHVLQIPEDLWLRRVSLHDQDATQLYAFETIDNAAKKITIVKWHFEENQLFRTLFPEIAYTGEERPWNNTCLRIRRVGERRKDAEGTFEAIGVGGALQSRHYKMAWEDDLVGESARKSQTVMDDTIGWHGRLNGAFENATQKIRFGVSNRWGYADLNSWIRANEPEVLFYTRAAWEHNDETGEDEPIFPEQFPLEKLLKLRDGGSMSKYDFSCQYLNSPVLPGEREVDTSALHTYRVEQDGQIICNCGKTFYASALNRYMHYDPYNAKGAGSTSCPALVVIGTAYDGHVILLDYWLSKENYGRVYDQLFHYNDVWRPSLFTYEDVGHQNLTAYHIREIEKTLEYKAKHRKFPRIEAVGTGGRAKEARIREGLFPVIEKKKFATRSKHQTFLTMLETFPHRRLDHDYDLLDACAQGSKLWRFPLQEEEALNPAKEEKEYLEHFGAPYSHAGVL